MLEELVSEVLVGGVMLEIGAYVLEGEHDQEVATQISATGALALSQCSGRWPLYK